MLEVGDFVKIFSEFIYLCYQLDSYFGKGSLIDSCFSSNRYNIDNLTVNEISNKLYQLNDQCQNSQDLSPFEKIYLCKHIKALLTQIEIKEKKTDYIYTISKLYDIYAKIPKHICIEELHSILNELLLECGFKKGTLNQRIANWEQYNKINASDFVKMAKGKANEYYSIIKNKMNSFVDFSKIHDVLDLKMVETNEGWSAYNYYVNNFSGVIEFNSSYEFNQYSLNTFISHEGYPGHHTSCLIKEYLYKYCNANELITINLLNTPSSLIEEGIGDCGLKIIGLENYEDINYKIEAIMDKLNAEAYYYAAYNYYYNNYSEDQIYQILINDKLHANEKSANRAMKFIKNWGYYIPTYKYGREIVGNLISQYNDSCLKLLYSACCNSIIKEWVKNNE